MLPPTVCMVADLDGDAGDQDGSGGDVGEDPEPARGGHSHETYRAATDRSPNLVGSGTGLGPGGLAKGLSRTDTVTAPARSPRPLPEARGWRCRYSGRR